jgi:hypothetical protein
MAGDVLLAVASVREPLGEEGVTSDRPRSSVVAVLPWPISNERGGEGAWQT